MKDNVWEGVVSRIGPSSVGVIGSGDGYPPASTFYREEFNEADLLRLEEGSRIRWTRGYRDEGETRVRIFLVQILDWAFRCGWCGMPCGSDGEPMGDDAPVTTGKTKHLNGTCCPNGDEPPLVQVIHEMALDAGEPDMEGRWVPW